MVTVVASVDPIRLPVQGTVADIYIYLWRSSTSLAYARSLLKSGLREPQNGLLDRFSAGSRKVVPGSPRTASWSDFRPGAGKWPQRAPERPPGAIFGREAESGLREPQNDFLERFSAESRKVAPEIPRPASWSDFWPGAGKSPQRAPEQRPGAIFDQEPESGPRESQNGFLDGWPGAA